MYLIIYTNECCIGIIIDINKSCKLTQFPDEKAALLLRTLADISPQKHHILGLLLIQALPEEPEKEDSFYSFFNYILQISFGYKKQEDEDNDVNEGNNLERERERERPHSATFLSK